MIRSRENFCLQPGALLFTTNFKFIHKTLSSPSAMEIFTYSLSSEQFMFTAKLHTVAAAPRRKNRMENDTRFRTLEMYSIKNISMNVHTYSTDKSNSMR
jgi:hypothetical protein